MLSVYRKASMDADPVSGCGQERYPLLSAELPPARPFRAWKVDVITPVQRPMSDYHVGLEMLVGPCAFRPQFPLYEFLQVHRYFLTLSLSKLFSLAFQLVFLMSCRGSFRLYP